MTPPRLAFALLLASALFGAACATPRMPPICDGRIRPVQEQQGTTVVYSVENACFVPAAIELSFPVLEGAEADRALPVQQVIPAGSAQRVTTIRALNGTREWQVRAMLSVLWFGTSPPVVDPSVVYEFPFGGTESRVLAQGEDGEFTHNGIHRYAYDFTMPIGTPVVAARAGVVVLVVDGFGEGGASERHLPRANLVLVLHDDGTIAKYGHLSKGIAILPGTRVAAGDFLASSGNSGYSKGPHLHFEVNAQEWVADGQRSIPVRFLGAPELAEGRSYGPSAAALRVGAQ